MKVVAINATYRRNGTTTTLTERALEGARAGGAETEMILLMEKDIRPCKNCLQCYCDLGSAIAPCKIDDDVTGVLEKIVEADGVLFSSPVHNGFVSGLAVVFFERLVWRLCRSTGTIAAVKGCPEPRSSKVRALGSIVSAGGMPERLRKYCDGTPWLKENMSCMLNGCWVGDIYAGAHLTKLPETDEEWQKLYFARRLSRPQLQAAHDLGLKLAQTIKRGGLRVAPPMGPVTTAVVKLFMSATKLYPRAEEE